MHFPLIDKISSGLSFDFLNFIGGSKVVPLVYHTIGSVEELPYLEGLYTIIDPVKFESDIDFILRKYKPIDLEGMVSFKQNGILPDKSNYFFLSFDDGLRSCKEIIAPILEKKGIPATFFINSGFVDNKEFLFRFQAVMLSKALKKDKTENLKNKLEEYLNLQFTCRYKAAKHVMTLRYPQKKLISELINHLGLPIDEQLKTYKPYLTREDIKELISNGFTVGAHSIDHPEYYLLSEQEQLAQTCESIQQIIHWFHPKYKVFAFPFTDVGVNSSFFEQLEKLCKPDLTFACSGLKTDKILNNVHRIPMDDSGLSAEHRLKSEFLYYFLKRPFGKNTFRRK